MRQHEVLPVQISLIMQQIMRVANDIEVFVLTWNRVSLLREALGSLLRQTVAPRRIVVVDNASTDGTLGSLRPIAEGNPHVHLVRQPVHVDACKNLMTAIDNAETNYFMVMHDDDILDRECISCFDKVLAENVEVSMVCSAQRSFRSLSDLNGRIEDRVWYEVFHSSADFVAADFARFLRRQEDSLCFPSVLYRKDCVSTGALQGTLFGKIVDKPLVYGSMGTGKIVRICSPLYNYRNHAGQDTNATSNGPYPEEILNLLEVYRQMLSGNRLYLKAFKALSIRLMKSLYFWGGNAKGDWHNFVSEARLRALTGAVVDRPWRLPFWRWNSKRTCERLLQQALSTVDRRMMRIDGTSREPDA